MHGRMFADFSEPAPNADSIDCIQLQQLSSRSRNECERLNLRRILLVPAKVIAPKVDSWIE